CHRLRAVRQGRRGHGGGRQALRRVRRRADEAPGPHRRRGERVPREELPGARRDQESRHRMISARRALLAALLAAVAVSAGAQDKERPQGWYAEVTTSL